MESENEKQTHQLMLLPDYLVLLLCHCTIIVLFTGKFMRIL